MSSVYHCLSNTLSFVGEGSVIGVTDKGKSFVPVGGYTVLGDWRPLLIRLLSLMHGKRERRGRGRRPLHKGHETLDRDNTLSIIKSPG